MTEYQEGFVAGRNACRTWLDCPYTEFDPISAYKRRKWLDGFDAGRAAEMDE